jgi:hypothetical protein
MNRRKFIKRGLLFVPFVPNIIARATGPIPHNPHIRTVVASGGGGGCTTARDANSAASNGTTAVNSTTTRDWVGSPFTAAASYDACKVGVWIDKLGSPTFSLYVSIWSDGGGNVPVAQIGVESAALDVSTLGTTEAEVTFDITASGITNGTKYWVVLRGAPNGTTSDHVRWYRNSVGTGTNSIARSEDGATWVNESSTRRSKFQVYSA